MLRYLQRSNDCFRTCIGCLLEIDPSEIVDFKKMFFSGETADGVPLWHIELEKWLNARGYTRRVATEEEVNSDELLIAIGLSVRGINHAEIYANGKFIYDPSGANKPLKEIFCFQKIDRYEYKEEIS